MLVMLVRARGHPLTMISVDHVGFWLLFACGCGRVGGCMSDLGQGNQDWVQNIFGNMPSRLAKCNSAKLCDCDVGWVVVRLWLPRASSQ